MALRVPICVGLAVAAALGLVASGDASAIAGPPGAAERVDHVADLSAMDRPTQLAAVAALTSAGDDPGEELVELWRTTDRSDVRAMIARVLADRQRDGVDALLAIASIDDRHWREEHPDMIAWALAAHGEPGMLAFVDADPEKARLAGSIAATAARLADLDVEQVATYMLSSRDARRQAFALGHLSWTLDGPRNSMRLVSMCRRGDDRVRYSAGRALPTWTEEQRKADPRGFMGYRRALEGLLSLPDENVVALAMNAIKANGGATIGAASTLDRIMSRSTVHERRRIAAIELFVTIERPERAQAKAVDEVVSLLDELPEPVGRALALIDPDSISGEAFEQIINSQDRWGHNHAFRGLLSPVAGDHQSGYARQIAISRRAEPMLIEKLRRGGDDAVQAARMLGSLRQAGPDAVEALLGAIGTANGFEWDALLAIAPDDPRVRQSIEDALQLQDPKHEPPAGVRMLVWGLKNRRADPAWVGQMLRPVAKSPDHVLRSWIWDFTDPDVLIAMEGYEAMVLPTIADDHQREAWERLIKRKQFDESSSLLKFEGDRRVAAAEAIGKHPSPSREAIDALLGALIQIPLDEPAPTRQGLTDAQLPQFRAQTTARNYDLEVGDAMARALAQALERRPDMIVPAIDALVNNQTVLAWTLATRVTEADGRGSTLVALPVGMDERLQYAVVGALSRGIDVRYERHRKYYGRPFAVALGRAPVQDPAALSRLLTEARTSPDAESAAEAIEGLGYVRPVSPEALETIREALTGPPRDGRDAGLRAAAALGSAGRPLLDDLVAVERERLALNADPLVAMRLIAPDDPRIAELESARKSR